MASSRQPGSQQAHSIGASGADRYLTALDHLSECVADQWWDDTHAMVPVAPRQGFTVSFVNIGSRLFVSSERILRLERCLPCVRTDGAPLPDDEEAPMDWDWVRETALDIGGSFVFAHDAPPALVMTAFGMNPVNARLVPASDVDEVLHDSRSLRTHPPEHPWIRVGVAGEWGFAIDESSSGYGGYEDGAARELSAGTEAVLFTHTQTIDYFHYYVDCAEVTAFEPLRGWERFGTQPDRFAEQMRQVGLRTDVDDDHDVADPVTALLEMLTVALGIWIPRDVALGPLLTVQRY